MRDSFGNTIEPIDSNEEKTFLCEYKFKGATWGFQIKAESQEDAEQRLFQIGKGQVLGELKASVPYHFGWLVKVWAWIANL